MVVRIGFLILALVGVAVNAGEPTKTVIEGMGQTLNSIQTQNADSCLPLEGECPSVVRNLSESLELNGALSVIDWVQSTYGKSSLRSPAQSCQRILQREPLGDFLSSLEEASDSEWTQFVYNQCARDPRLGNESARRLSLSLAFGMQERAVQNGIDALAELAYLDQVLDEPPLGGVSCNEKEFKVGSLQFAPALAKFCAEQKKSCNDGQNFEGFSDSARKDHERLLKLRSRIAKTNDEKVRGVLEADEKEILERSPWLAESVFENPVAPSSFRGVLKEVIGERRNKIKGRYRQNLRASACLQGVANPFMCRTSQLANLISRSSEPLTDEQIRARAKTVNGRGARDVVGRSLQHSRCLETTLFQKIKTNRTLSRATIDVALTIATGPIGRLAAAKSSKEAGTATSKIGKGLRKRSQAGKATPTKYRAIAQNTMMGIEAYWAGSGINEARQACESQLKPIQRGTSSLEGENICRQQAGFSEMQRNMSECLTAAAFAVLDSVPFVQTGVVRYISSGRAPKIKIDRARQGLRDDEANALKKQDDELKSAKTKALQEKIERDKKFAALRGQPKKWLAAAEAEWDELMKELNEIDRNPLSFGGFTTATNSFGLRRELLGPKLEAAAKELSEASAANGQKSFSPDELLEWIRRPGRSDEELGYAIESSIHKVNGVEIRRATFERKEKYSDYLENFGFGRIDDGSNFGQTIGPMNAEELNKAISAYNKTVPEGQRVTIKFLGLEEVKVLGSNEGKILSSTEFVRVWSRGETPVVDLHDLSSHIEFYTRVKKTVVDAATKNTKEIFDLVESVPGLSKAEKESVLVSVSNALHRDRLNPKDYSSAEFAKRVREGLERMSITPDTFETAVNRLRELAPDLVSRDRNFSQRLQEARSSLVELSQDQLDEATEMYLNLQ